MTRQSTPTSNSSSISRITPRTFRSPYAFERMDCLSENLISRWTVSHFHLDAGTVYPEATNSACWIQRVQGEEYRELQSYREPIHHNRLTLVSELSNLHLNSDEDSEADTRHAGVHVLRTLLETTIDAGPDKRYALLDYLSRIAEPKMLLDAAFDCYRRTESYDYLLATISILEQKGMDAWPAWERLSAMKSEEIELFVASILSCIGVSEAKKCGAALRLAKSPCEGVRDAVLQELGRLQGPSQRRVLHLLRNDPSEELRLHATDWLAELEEE